MSGVGILCFTASYAIALCLEISRVFFRSSMRNLVAVLWIVAGLTAHTAYLFYHHTATLVLVDGAESYFFVSAWGVVLVLLYLACFHPKTPFGLILLPIAMLLILGGILAPDVPTKAPSPETLSGALPELSLWKRIHAGTFFLATLAVCIGFVAGILYLFQDRRLKLKKPPLRLLNLPTIEWSLSICRHAIGASTILLGACIFSGLLLKSAPSKSLGAVTLGDPLVVGTVLIFLFLLLFSGLLSARLFKTEGRHVAVLTLLAFLFLFCMLVLALWMRSAHWRRPETTVVGIAIPCRSCCLPLSSPSFTPTGQEVAR